MWQSNRERTPASGQSPADQCAGTRRATRRHRCCTCLDCDLTRRLPRRTPPLELSFPATAFSFSDGGDRALANSLPAVNGVPPEFPQFCWGIRGFFTGYPQGSREPRTKKVVVLSGVSWCCRTGLNCRPLPYQGSALPLSYGSTTKRRLQGTPRRNLPQGSTRCKDWCCDR
jgi:hypothetical protein